MKLLAIFSEPKHEKRSGGQTRTFVDLLEADTEDPRDCLLAAMDDRIDWIKSHGGPTQVDQVVVVGVVMCHTYIFLNNIVLRAFPKQQYHTDIFPYSTMFFPQTAVPY